MAEELTLTRSREVEAPGFLQTTAGDWEQESKPRWQNGAEAFGVMAFILTALWVINYSLGKMLGVPGMDRLGSLLLFAGALYLLFVAPRLHRDSLSSWGLGNPATLWRMLTEGPIGRRALLGTTVASIFLVLNYVNYQRWPDVARFLQLHRTPVAEFHTHFPGILAVLAFGVTVSCLILTYGIRYDNFWSAFRVAMLVALPLFVVICLGAYAQRGVAAFSDFAPAAFFIGVFGYLFWGFVQQLLFSSYFGTRIRKAFGPSHSPGNRLPSHKRLPAAMLFGLCTAVIASVSIFAGLRYLYGPEETPASAILWFAVFSFPAGAIYGYVYTLDRKRLLVATLSASCFGLIHLISYGLVVGTWILGIFLTYVFMEDRYRNLVALGFIHGLLGTTLNWLFSKGQSGVMEINYRVGPEAIREPSWGLGAVPLLFLAGYVALAIWSRRRLKGEPAPAPARPAA